MPHEAARAAQPRAVAGNGPRSRRLAAGWRHIASVWRRGWLWIALVALVFAMLATLVWLAGRYEQAQMQRHVERDAADAAADIRSALERSLQGMHALPMEGADPAGWQAEAATFLRAQRAVMRIERRDLALAVRAGVDTPYRAPIFRDAQQRQTAQADVALACASARRFGGAAWSTSYFVTQPDSRGLELIDVCLPLVQAGSPTGYLIATWSLKAMLGELVGPQLMRGQQISFTEADGTRLATLGAMRRGGRTAFSARQFLNLPGATLVLRIDNARSMPDLFPNVMTALVTGMSVALVSVLVLLGRDIQRRQQVERDLAEALAFRKAMENSLITGLRARDLEGRVTYVNPAFCEMVGFSADELLGRHARPPYWPPELAHEYQQRQAARSLQHAPPREGFESIYQRKEGSRFPVLIIEAPLIDAHGTQTGWMSALLDLSEQRRVEELSRASQERLQASARLAAVGEMASLLSHELNQPLAAISSYATGSLNLLRQAPADGEIEHAMRRIAAQAERAGKVIKSVHDFVRRRDQQHEAVAPQALLDAILPLLALQARKLHVQLQVDVQAGLPRVVCDRTMVEQVLLNLARNGMQAMDQPELRERVLHIRVRLLEDAAAPGRWLDWSLADLGCGITAGVQERLFTPFFTTRPDGMGLGLSLCRTVVEQHGGQLAFEPNRPRGTLFRFTLPVTAEVCLQRHATHA